MSKSKLLKSCFIFQFFGKWKKCREVEGGKCLEKKIFDIQERIQTEKKRRRTLGDSNYFFCRERENRDWKGEKKNLLERENGKCQSEHKHTDGIVKLENSTSFGISVVFVFTS